MVSANRQGTIRVRKTSKLNKSNCRGAGANVISLSNPVWSEFSESVKIFIPSVLKILCYFRFTKGVWKAKKLGNAWNRQKNMFLVLKVMYFIQFSSKVFDFWPEKFCKLFCIRSLANFCLKIIEILGRTSKFQASNRGNFEYRIFPNT